MKRWQISWSLNRASLYFQPSVQATFGHTEGAAGITGMLLALKAVQQAASAPVVNLCNVNPYVVAALADWRAHSGSAALVPRQMAPGVLVQVHIQRLPPCSSC